MSVYSVDKLIAQTRRLAAEYRQATGKPLAVSGEIARHDAARLLGLRLVDPSEHGYDAVGTGVRDSLRVQIKGRAIFDERRSGHRLGQIKQSQGWDLLVLVLMDENFEPTEIYEAHRDSIEASLEEAVDSRRKNRGAMSVARFKIVGRLAWTRESGLEDDGFWENSARA